MIQLSMVIKQDVSRVFLPISLLFITYSEKLEIFFCENTHTHTRSIETLLDMRDIPFFTSWVSYPHGTFAAFHYHGCPYLIGEEKFLLVQHTANASSLYKY